MSKIILKPGELYLLKEDFQYYDQPPVEAGSIFMVVELKGSNLVEVLVGDHIQTWDTWDFIDCLEKI